MKKEAAAIELYRDPVTGYEIRRYTEGPERNAKLYRLLSRKGPKVLHCREAL